MLLLASLIVAVGLPAAAIDGNCNTQGGWQESVTSGAWGSITNNGGSVSVSLNAGYSLELCVKGGSGYEIYNLTSSGGPFWPPANCGTGNQQCGLSHWAIRNVVLTTTTAPPTTAPPTTAPPTTAPPTTEPTTPTTPSTSLPFDSVPEVETGVLGIQVSAPAVAQVATQETLPFTGISTGSMGLLAAAFAGVGLLLLLAARQNDEKSPARSWN